MKTDLMTEIQNLLWKLGVTGNYIGYHYACCAVYYSIEQPDCLLLVTKCLYPYVAKRYGTTSAAVERSIRTILDIVWQKSRENLEHFAQHELSKRPTVAQFISILAYGIIDRNAA